MNNINKNVLIIAVLAVIVGALSVFLILNQDYGTKVETLPFREEQNNNSDEEQAADTGKYIEIKEYGVRMPVLEGMEDVTYKRIVDKQPTYTSDSVQFFSKDVQMRVMASSNSKDQGCIDSPVHGLISRITEYPDGDDMAMREGSYIVGKYYLQYFGPQDVCTQNESIQDLISKKTNLVMQAFGKMQAIDGKPLTKVQQGHISGSIGYPAEKIPTDMTVCAELVDKSKSYCQSAHYLDPKYKYGEGFELTVPAGDYLVYATLAENPRDPKAKRAYYNQFVKCGMTAQCTDKTPIVVKVTNGAKLEKIDPIDWY